MPEKAVISHRGEKYEIGRGKRFYGIWVVGAPYEAPVDRWPENRDGWQQAWTRFATIEVPGTITPVTRERRGFAPRLPRKTRTRPRGGYWLLAGEGLLVLGVVLGLAGLFPDYEGKQSLLSQWDQVVPHLCYVIGWMLTAALVALSVARPSNAARYGALFGLGLSAVTFGLFLGDLGQVTSGGVALGSGLVLSLLGWVACTAGSALALASGPGYPAQPEPAQPGFAQPGFAQPEFAQSELAQPGLARPELAQPGLAQSELARPGFAQSELARPGFAQPGLAGPQDQSGQQWQRSGPVRPGRRHVGPLALLVLAAIGTAAAFAPSWDRYILTVASTGTTQTITAGNAFDNPALVIAGNVLVMVAVIAVAVLAALWRPSRQGAMLLAGAILPLATEAISALIQAGQPATPAMFGISSAQAASAGLTISSGLTGIFWVFFVFVISLLVSCAWLFTEPGQPAMAAFPASPWLPAGPVAGTPSVRGEVVSDADDSDARGDADSAAVDSDTGGEGGEQSAYV